MSDINANLRKLVNASGFLFQLRIEEEIRNTQGRRNNKWGVIAREHRWSDDKFGREGFIDLILESRICRIVIECKRVKEGNWVFLLPNENKPTTLARLLWSHQKKDRASISGYDDFIFSPESPESNFCIIRGQGEKDPPMLERISSNLLQSIECLADEELEIRAATELGSARLYIPMIITNATLLSCRFDVNEIEMSTGKIEKTLFEPVPFIKFRKNMSTNRTTTRKAGDLREANIENERTVLVVNANVIGNYLEELSIPKSSNFMYSEKWPWDIARDLEKTTTNKLE